MLDVTDAHLIKLGIPIPDDRMRILASLQLVAQKFNRSTEGKLLKICSNTAGYRSGRANAGLAKLV